MVKLIYVVTIKCRCRDVCLWYDYLAQLHYARMAEPGRRDSLKNCCRKAWEFNSPFGHRPGVTQRLERQFSKLEVVGSNPISWPYE